MSVAQVLRLAEHRDRRLHRLALAQSMLRADPSRIALLDHLAEVADLTGSDRVATVWIDEYGQGLVHPHLVLDLLSDRPRRFFSAEPLQRAWDCGVPGAFDEAAEPIRDGSAAFAVALGSDGARGWFLVADSVSRRGSLDPSTRDRVLFLAGECSAIVLHRDLEGTEADGPSQSFAGWRFLRDLEGREDEQERSDAVGRRFEVGRLVSILIDEDLCIAEERRMELTARVRESLRAEISRDAPELEIAEDLLRTFESGDLTGLAAATLAAGFAAEREDHVHGALEYYRFSYELGVAVGEPRRAIEAARASGRTLRRHGDWKAADRWYTVALGIAERAEVWDLIARTRAGLAVIHKERGDLAVARDGLHEALSAAETAMDAETTASIYHDLMTLEQLSGDLPVAARHGWRAVNTFESEEGRSRCLVSFAWILKELGDVEAAEDAYAVARETSDELYYRVYAADGFAHMAALRGDAEAFDRRAAECDAMGWEAGPLTAKAEIMLFRGLSHRLLGRESEALRWFERARQFSREHGLGRIAGRVDAALAGRESAPADVSGTNMAPTHVREGLRAMRHQVVKARA